MSSFYDSKVCGQPSRCITFNEINALVKDWAGVIIDVRSRKEVQETGCLPCSINIPIDELEDALSMTGDQFSLKYNHKKPNRYAKIIFSCCNGRRSAEALRLALGMGYINPYNYSGGWSDWKAHIDGQKAANKCEKY